ncbi:molybdopterin molybdotransferase MoeA [Marisediminicola senii]|uniref:molybdopterin molybdotransferase MoeA n=1 Tax=Marisediminicola senii TaxID=2711233 RepID=UPI0013EA7768|nr:gephyrin-like molybdotransferase Glp [Marisediminicola senii]
MRSVAEHQRVIRDLLAPLANREPLAVTGLGPAALAQFRDYHRVLATAVVSPIDLPPFDNSQMDGYAVRAADVVPGRSLTVAAPVAAGSGPRTHRPGEATPIMTGAPIPRGADAVIPIEAATPAHFPQASHAGSARPATVRFDRMPQPGAYIRPRGSDVAEGTELVHAGRTLGPAQWGIVAASGVTTLDFVRPVHVLLISTGDELRPSGEPLQPGQIYDANGMALAIALTECHATLESVLVTNDDLDTARAMLSEHAPWADLVVTTGGVSAGIYEVARDLFEASGVVFDSVAMQPGGPQGCGTASLFDPLGVAFEVPVISFPGNPVSALVSFEMFLRPVLRELHGLPPRRRTWRAPLAADLDSPEGKHQVRRGRMDATGAVELVGGPSSHLLHGYASSTLLVHVPVGVSHLAAGDTVDVWSIDD